MDLDLDGKAVIVTGASRGIGSAIAKLFLEEGAFVLGTTRSKDTILPAVQATGTTGRLRVAALDLLDPEGPATITHRALEEFGRIDAVVNNAASFEYLTMDDVSRTHWWELAQQKLVFSCDVIRHARAALAASGNGAVVNVAGIAGCIPRGEAPHVGAVNAGVINMTQFFAAKLAPQRIRVNAVSPGDTSTDRRQARLVRLQSERGLTREAAEAELAAALPLGRAVTPEEVAAVVVMLCSSRLGGVSGSNILVDGGSFVGR